MIKIKEVLANPVGRDKGGEYIILVNDGAEAKSLTGWKIKDKSGKSFSLNGYVIEGGEGLRFSDEVSKLVLNNSNEVIELLNPLGEVVDKLEYSSLAEEGLPILQDAKITDEIKNQLFDELVDSERVVNQGVKNESFMGFGLLIFLVAFILAMIAVVVFQKINGNNNNK